MAHPEFIHGDRALPALVHGGELPWLPSPEPGVERRMLERIGGEVALATSIVRYAPHSRFAGHRHERGEEFLVLEGVFSDEHGHYPAGTYVRNPPGSAHHPFSEPGCTIFVKLRQMTARETQRAVVFPQDLAWRDTGPGLQEALLHRQGGATVHLQRLGAGCELPARDTAAGEEILVVEGRATFDNAGTPLGRWGWSRNACGRQPPVASATGALLWIKRGHLAGP